MHVLKEELSSSDLFPVGNVILIGNIDIYYSTCDQ